MFTVRTIQPGESPDSARVESAQYDLEPQLPQGRTVCNLFAQFLSERPPEFREPLPFLNKFAVELDWAAAGGGSAFASLFHEGKPLGMAVLLSGADPESDEQMLQAIHLSILQPLLGGERAEDLGFALESIGERQIQAFANRAQRTGDAARPVLEALREPRLRARQQLLGLDHFVHESDRERAFRRNMSPVHDQFGRHAAANQVGAAGVALVAGSRAAGAAAKDGARAGLGVAGLAAQALWHMLAIVAVTICNAVAAAVAVAGRYLAILVRPVIRALAIPTSAGRHRRC